MNLLETDEERSFRTRVRDWMAQHLCGEFDALRYAASYINEPVTDLEVITITM